MLFLERLQENCRKQPSKTAIEFRFECGTQQVTYSELLNSVQRATSWLARHGIRSGNTVAVQLPKSVLAFELHLAACSLGAISMPLNPAYSAAELEYILNDSEAKLLIRKQFSKDATENPFSAIKALAKIVAVDIHKLRDQFPVGNPVSLQVPTDPDRTALMLYTSGTTGHPKGACISHASLTANMDMLAEAWQWSSDDVLLHTLPIFHVHGLLVALHGALHAGASCIMYPHFDPQQVLHELQAGKCNVYMGVPTMYRRILEAVGNKPISLSHMRLLTSGSDRLPIESFQGFEKLSGMRLLERYGMTETGILCSNPLHGNRKPGHVGVPLPGVEMRITDPETGRVLENCEVGELQTRGPHVFSGYWKDPEKTSRSFTEDAWFRTGDLGCCTADGSYELKGRMSDLIISGGFNVYPAEVEQVLLTHPDVEQCAVIGLPDPEWGESVTAYVVPGNIKPNESDLIEHCRQVLVFYKCPKRVLVVDSLPRNAMGKVQKSTLRKTAIPDLDA